MYLRGWGRCSITATWNCCFKHCPDHHLQNWRLTLYSKKKKKKTFVKQIIRADLSHLVMFLLPCHLWQWAQIWNKLNKVFNNEKVYSSDAISILLPFLSEFITQIYLLFKFFVYLNYYKCQWFILNQLLGRWNLDLSIKVKDLIPFLKKKNSDSQRAVSCLCWLTQ